MWRFIAKIIARPAVAGWLIQRAMRTPYVHLPDYMDRFWLFNPYEDADGRRDIQGWLGRRLPSIRLHHILREDLADHLHDHPWDARTIILSGWYREWTEEGVYLRRPGDTRRILFGEYHHISEVSPGGVWTLFITWKYRGTWGFKVDGVKIPYREYLARYKR